MKPDRVCVEMNLCDETGGEGKLKEIVKEIFVNGMTNFYQPTKLKQRCMDVERTSKC